MAVALRPGIERAREDAGAPVVPKATIAPQITTPVTPPVTPPPPRMSTPPMAPFRAGPGALALRAQTTRAIDSRLSQMVDTKKFVKKDDAAGLAQEALRTVAILQPGASPALMRLVSTARLAAESYARGAPVDPLPSFAAVAAAVTSSSPIHEREIKSHLAAAIAAAARSLAVHDPEGPHGLVAAAIAPFSAD